MCMLFLVIVVLSPCMYVYKFQYIGSIEIVILIVIVAGYLRRLNRLYYAYVLDVAIHLMTNHIRLMVMEGGSEQAVTWLEME